VWGDGAYQGQTEVMITWLLNGERHINKKRERKSIGCSSQPVKPKPAIWDKDKWNASVEAEIAKQQTNQPNWLQRNALAATNGMWLTNVWRDQLRLWFVPIRLGREPGKRAPEEQFGKKKAMALISVLVDIFYLANSGCFDKTGVFQQPRLITTVDLLAHNSRVSRTRKDASQTRNTILELLRTNEGTFDLFLNSNLDRSSVPE
jgi:hypothetical protein